MLRETAQSRVGQQIDCIAPVMEVNVEQFGFTMVSVDGQVLPLGDATADLSIQSV